MHGLIKSLASLLLSRCQPSAGVKLEEDDVPVLNDVVPSLLAVFSSGLEEKLISVNLINMG